MSKTNVRILGVCSLFLSVVAVLYLAAGAIVIFSMGAATAKAFVLLIVIGLWCCFSIIGGIANIYRAYKAIRFANFDYIKLIFKLSIIIVASYFGLLIVEQLVA